nr:unnamed protein product [Spirometra erinaceieuropaei]
MTGRSTPRSKETCNGAWTSSPPGAPSSVAMHQPSSNTDYIIPCIGVNSTQLKTVKCAYAVNEHSTRRSAPSVILEPNRNYRPCSNLHVDHDCIQRFLGMVNFYQQFRPKCANSILPFTSLLSGPKRSFRLSADALAAFDEVKAALADATLLTHFSPNVPISLMVDASNVSVGAISQQHLAGHTQPLAFFSRKLPADETWYSTFGRELLAAFLAVKHFRRSLEVKDFTVFRISSPFLRFQILL